MTTGSNPYFGSSEGRIQSVGAVLRAAREAKQIKIETIADALCIRALHLRALEDGEYAQLPALVYARGFVRSYAEYLQLDSKKLLEQFRSETAESEAEIDAAFTPSEGQQQLPKSWMLAVAGAALVLIIGLWSWRGDPAPVPASEPELAANTADVIPPFDENAPQGAEASVADAETAAAAVDAAAVPVFPDSPVVPPAVEAPVVALSTPLVMTPILPPLEKPAAVKPATLPPEKPAPAPEKTATTPPPESGIILEAVADAWVEITDPSGKVVFNRVLRRGQTYNLPQNLAGSFLSTGNAGGLLAKYNGKALGLLGHKGEVVHNIILDAPELRSRAVSNNL